MKTKILRFCTATAAIATAASGAAAYANMLPSKYAVIAGIAMASILGVKEVAVIIGDIADDGQRNNSFKA